MHHRRKHKRLGSIIYIEKNLSVRFDFNEKEKCIGTSEELQHKFEKLRSIGHRKKIHRNKNKMYNQTLNKSQIPLLNQRKNKTLYAKNLNNCVMNTSVLQSNCNSNSLNSNISNQFISNIFELKKNNSIDEKTKDTESKLPVEKEENSFFNLENSFSFSDSDSYILDDYLNNDDQSNENDNYFNSFLF